MTGTDVADAALPDLPTLTADLVAAYVSNNHVGPGELPALIATLHAALVGLSSGKSGPTEEAAAKPTPAQVRRSITHDNLISFEDGKPYKTLRRHLTLRGLSAEAYREKWGLPRDYPMTAAGYSETRSALAKSLGLGQIRRPAAPESVPAEEPAPVVEPAPETPKRAGRARKDKAPT